MLRSFFFNKSKGKIGVGGIGVKVKYEMWNQDYEIPDREGGIGKARSCRWDWGIKTVKRKYCQSQKCIYLKVFKDKSNIKGIE